MTFHNLFRCLFHLTKGFRNSSCQIERKNQSNDQCSCCQPQLKVNQRFLHFCGLLIVFLRVFFCNRTDLYQRIHSTVHQRLIFIKQHGSGRIHIHLAGTDYRFLQLHCFCNLISKGIQQFRITGKMAEKPVPVLLQQSHFLIHVCQIRLNFLFIIRNGNKRKVFNNNLQSAAHTHNFMGNLIPYFIKFRILFLIFPQT